MGNICRIKMLKGVILATKDWEGLGLVSGWWKHISSLHQVQVVCNSRLFIFLANPGLRLFEEPKRQPGQDCWLLQPPRCKGHEGGRQQEAVGDIEGGVGEGEQSGGGGASQ